MVDGRENYKFDLGVEGEYRLTVTGTALSTSSISDCDMTAGGNQGGEGREGPDPVLCLSLIPRTAFYML
ncbi:hypothetical protein pdam_00021720, partial [Pocillopora damicornis]